MGNLVLQLLCGALAAWALGLAVRAGRGRRNFAAGAAGALVARIGYAVVLGDGFGWFDAPFDLETLVAVGLGGLAGLAADGLAADGLAADGLAVDGFAVGWLRRR